MIGARGQRHGGRTEGTRRVLATALVAFVGALSVAASSALGAANASTTSPRPDSHARAETVGKVRAAADPIPVQWRAYISATWQPYSVTPALDSAWLIASRGRSIRTRDLLFSYSFRGQVCLAFGTQLHYAYGSCEPATSLCETTTCSGASPLFYNFYGTEDRLLILEAGAAVTSVTVHMPRDQRVSLTLSRRQGVIWLCRGRCTCSVNGLTARSGARVLAIDSFRNPATGRSYWCTG